MRIAFLICVSCLILVPSNGPAAPDGGTVTGRVVVMKGKTRIDAEAVWVYLRPVGKQRGRQFAKQNKNIRQQGTKFLPPVQVVSLNSSIGFPNNDKYEHSVFATSTKTQPGFDLGRYVGGAVKQQPFAVPGEYDIYCDLHSNMSAKVKVVESEWYTEVKNGAFKLEHVPAGTYELRAWMPDSVEVFENVLVEDGAVVTSPELHLQDGKTYVGPTKPHQRVLGGDYPIYNKRP
jgi:plastocyanin